MITYPSLKQKPRVFKKLTGLSVSKFDNLDSDVQIAEDLPPEEPQ